MRHIKKKFRAPVLAAALVAMLSGCGLSPQQARPELFGDVVLLRKEAPASYHLAATLDDAADGVTLVCDKAHSQDIKTLLAQLREQPGREPIL